MGETRSKVRIFIVYLGYSHGSLCSYNKGAMPLPALQSTKTPKKRILRRGVERTSSIRKEEYVRSSSHSKIYCSHYL